MLTCTVHFSPCALQCSCLCNAHASFGCRLLLSNFSGNTQTIAGQLVLSMALMLQICVISKQWKPLVCSMGDDSLALFVCFLKTRDNHSCITVMFCLAIASLLMNNSSFIQKTDILQSCTLLLCAVGTLCALCKQRRITLQVSLKGTI